MAIKKRCPRCGGNLEVLRTYSHCSGCFYFEDYWSDPEIDNLKALREAKEMISYNESEIDSKEEAEQDEKDCA